MLKTLGNIFCERTQSPNKKLPVKVTDVKRTRKIGLIVSSVAELLKKARSLLVGDQESIFVALEDGTEVVDDEYLLTLASNTLLVVSPTKPCKTGSLQDAMEKYLAAVHELQRFHSEQILSFMQENSDERLKLTWQYVTALEKGKTHLSSIKEHPEWFKGCNKLVTTKEEYFRKCAQGRIRSYLRDARTRLKISSPFTGQKVVDVFKNQLEEHHYYAGYFDRKADAVLSDRLCDPAGTFRCEGKYDQPACVDGHVINPYDNAESRILFSTWNLDHVMERAVLLNELGGLLLTNGIEPVCLQRYYDLLFTRKNLKLVHKTCHVIGPHNFQHCSLPNVKHDNHTLLD